MKKVFVGSVAFVWFAGACLIGCIDEKVSEGSKKSVQQDTIPVAVLSLAMKDFISYGEYYGKVRGIKEATLVCYGGGTVEKISVKEGTRVSAGKSLAKIDTLRNRNAFETAEMNERVALSNFERLKKHLESGNASQVAVDQANLAWLQSKTQRINAQKMRRGALCITPIPGIITARFIEEHQEIPPGSPTFTVSQMHKMKITIGIPESEIQGVKEGNGARITFSVFPERKWKGTVHRLAREVSNENRSFNAELHVANKDGTLLPGLTAHVKLILQNLTNRIVIPTSAIMTEGEENFVMIAAENNLAEKYTIETGFSNKTHTVVTAGLEAGLRLITEGHHLVSSGLPVRINNRHSKD